MIIKDIIYPYVYVTDTTTGEGLRIHVKEFGNRPQPGAELEFRDSKYYCTTVTVDVDCPGGVCPIK